MERESGRRKLKTNFSIKRREGEGSVLTKETVNKTISFPFFPSKKGKFN